MTSTALSSDGFQLGAVHATDGELSFTITTADGHPVTRFGEAHGKQLHLIVVRSDGAYFRHRHPVLDPATGVWTIPWTWEAAGSYRVFTDFTPDGGPGVTLSRTVEVPGEYRPWDPLPHARSETDGYTVTLEGALGNGTILTARVTRNGQPVPALERYLGSYGHLVALRQGDLAYLHIHALEGEPADGIRFHAEAPTAGRYLLYLDFQVDGVAHTAGFVLDAESEKR
ncbi:hypothetical protein [Amycolatopsis jejuensis]|uniref:hypothetical protein n=1 Tax=Amycolatopsis jejuensis TaxID=330084 RepID=UPI00068B0B55|nr:hypothetical protein [Amycolatopsis jejuensis]